MGRLVYSSITSLDGYVVDASGSFDWAAPDAEVHQFVNDLERSVGSALYGRRMYEVMTWWERRELLDDEEPVIRDYAGLWQATQKVVFSRTLTEVRTAATRVERSFDPALVQRIVQEADSDVSIGGAELAGQAVQAGLVAELHLFVVPVIVGGGRRWLPDDLRLDLRLLDERRFTAGTVYLRYAT